MSKMFDALMTLASIALACEVPAPDWMNPSPFPSRTGRLNVSPSPLPDAPHLVLRDEYYNARIWPMPTPLPANQKPVVGWIDPNPGTRWIAPPELQTWNPYLRGDPDEIVDYYEGYTLADKLARQATPVANCNCRVKRRDTPMWRAAELFSIDLPARDNSEPDGLKDARWEAYAARGQAWGMDVPMEDPRVITPLDPRWQDVPPHIDNIVLRHQLYHSLRAPLDYSGDATYHVDPANGGRMKGDSARPIIWQRA
jgi:hypothetical protein